VPAAPCPPPGGAAAASPTRRPARRASPLLLQATGLTAQSYRKAVTTARRDKKAGTGPKGLTEEQKQEIREAFDLFDTDGSGTLEAKVGAGGAGAWWLGLVAELGGRCLLGAGCSLGSPPNPRFCQPAGNACQYNMHA
jgi:hypothetical protein